MEYTIRNAALKDLPRIQEIYDCARSFMRSHGNPNQWANNHPPASQLEADIGNQRLFVITNGNMIHGVFYFYIGADPTYAKIHGAWRSDTAYGTIHRIAGDGSGGILKAAVAFGGNQIPHLRIDTHEDNYVMQNAVARIGFQRAGIIHLEDGAPRIAYDLLLK